MSDSAPLPFAHAHALLAAVPFDVERVRERLEASHGGYEILHASPGLEIGVYVLVAPELDRQGRTPTTRSTSCSTYSRWKDSPLGSSAAARSLSLPGRGMLSRATKG